MRCLNIYPISVYIYVTSSGGIDFGINTLLVFNFYIYRW